MADFTLDGRTKVKTLKANFKAAFGSTLRVYKSASCKGGFADDEATLASIRAEGYKGGDICVSGDMLVGDFERGVAELYGIGVQVANAGDTELADNNITLLEAGSEPVSSKPEETCETVSTSETEGTSVFEKIVELFETEEGETEEENVDYYANAPWPKFSFPSSWDEFEDLVEAFAVASVKRYGIFFSRNYVLGFLGLYVIGYVFGGLLTGPVMLYYLAKFLIRLIRISKGTYVPTPESKKGTLIPVLNNQWSEYAEWVKEFPIWGILGYIYVWLVVAVLLLPLTIVYIPYNIIRKNWDNKLAK